MISLLDYAKDFLRSCVPPDGIVADFTMGNGYDTEFLCRLVPEGTVYAFDVQPAALESTRSRLEAFGLTNAQLLLVSHADAARYIKGPLNGGMFNLGWLPGSDRTVFTRRERKAEKAQNSTSTARHTTTEISRRFRCSSTSRVPWPLSSS